MVNLDDQSELQHSRQPISSFLIKGSVLPFQTVIHNSGKDDGDDGKHKNLSMSAPSSQQSLHKEEHVQRNDSFSSPLLDKQCRRFSLAEIRLATNDFDDAFVIGKGGFGNVYKGRVDFGKRIDVAIKRLNLEYSSQGATEFRAEIEMLSKFRHSHIVSLLGYYEGSTEKEMILVYEYMRNGSLGDHLHKRKGNVSNSSQLTWIQRLNICIDAARGLDYLHTGTGVESRVIHRDIKSSNILLDENLVAKISDFGLSRIGPAKLVGTTNVYTDQIKGTFGYMDAEYFTTQRLTRKSDVYAFGVVLLEVLCGRPALDFTLGEEQHSLSVWAKKCIRKGKIDRIIDPYLRGKTRAKCLKDFGKIAYECLLACSKDRPTMTKVLAKLELVLSWTLQSEMSSRDQKDIGKSIFIEKAWSLFLIKAPIKGRVGARKKLGQSINNIKKGMMMEKHATTFVEGGVATASQQVVLPGKETKIPVLKMFTFSELRSATRNFRPDMLVGEGGFGRVYKGWLDSVTFVPRKAGVGLAVAIKRLNPESGQGFSEWQEFNVKLSDFGLAKLGPVNGESHVSTRIMGTYGYAAPEYIATGRLYVKSDVYGFGVVMLEMITGLFAVDKSRPNSQHLVEWARPSLNSIKKLQKIMDPRLEQFYPSKGAMEVAKLILNCLEPDPVCRPSMEKVAACLEEINTIKL
ncbi:probable receptor-like protein kinase At5g59700 [Lactuca sativa]|uniref:probable receptor-like protein kinase At5g59700 n=1 Tax=Lactuca sativa TaxID=4236 RepID=UPI001C68FDC8|nr:probable receptor-like protein kinase At5g59700 [Lactuca sativa]